MKTLIGFLLVLGTLNAVADDWPYDSECRRYGAESETVSLAAGLPSPVVLCRFGVSSYIEKDTLRNSNIGFGPQAVRAYFDSANRPFGEHCEMVGAHILQAKDSHGRSYSLCEFFDGSIMEEQTFSTGPNSLFNSEMNAALGRGLSLDF